MEILKKSKLLGFFILLIVNSQGLSASEIIKVVSGQQKIIFIGHPVDILIADSKIVKLDYTGGNRATIIGGTPGITSLTLKYKNGKVINKTIQVIAQDPHQVIKKLQELLKGIRNINFRVAGDWPIVEGEIGSTKDLEIFQAVMNRFPQVLNLVKIKKRKMAIGIAVKIIEANLSKLQDYQPLSTDGLNLNAQYRNLKGLLQSNWEFKVNINLLPKIEYW